MPLISMISQVQNESKIGQAYKEVGEWNFSKRNVVHASYS